jgi:Protein kinase domain
MSFTLGSDSSAPESPGRALFAGRYDVQRLLKSGNGVETFFAVDVATGAEVVLKAIDPAFVDPAARMRFQHETQVLRELSGLGLCTLYDAGQSDERLYLAQPFVPGETLEQVLRRGPLSVTDPVGTVTLVDFGFARSPWLDESIRDDFVGTVHYLAPESAGLLATPADERSDLYAVGVVLFECLAGRSVFPGPSVGDLLRQHLSMPVPELRTIGVAVPRSVDDLVQRLLRKDPAERYQSASALAADLGELLSAIEACEAEPRLVIGRRDQRRSLTDPSFVGRYAEVDALASLVGGLSGDAAGLVLLEADSGGGKSGLLNEISQQGSEAGVTVLHGQGVAQEGQRPFTLLHGVADELVALLDQDGPARSALKNDLQDVAPAVVRALPALGRLLDTTSEQDMGPEQFGELRSLAGLRRLLVSVA